MDAWNIDANQINFFDQLDGFQLVQNRAVMEFVEKRPHDSKFFIVAPKGIGKTLLLKYKSRQYRKQKGEFICIPEDELCERLTPTAADIAFAHEDLAHFTTVSHWAGIWCLCLMSIILKRVDSALPKELDKLFGIACSANDLLNILLRDRTHIFRYTRFVATHLSPAIGNIRLSVAVFIDNIDEAMDRHVGPQLREAGRNRGKSLGVVSERVWVSAQLGLMEAAKAINARNAHVKIFASIRLEAFNSDNSPTHTQTRDICTILKYSDTELKEIFESNIRSMRTEDLVNPRKPDLVERFLGVKNIQHPFVTENDRSPRFEDAFNYILRHTLRRPRELLWMGKEIAQIPVGRRDVAAISRCVNEVSTEILKQYKNEIVPFWDEVESEMLLLSIPANVITKNELEAIKAEDRNFYNAAFAAFYRRGLLGALHARDWGKGLVQSFLPATEHLFNESETLPESTHYLLHPCLEDKLKRKHGGEFSFDQFNIIGYDYPFVSISESKKRNQNVHFDHTLHIDFRSRMVFIDDKELNPKLELLHFGFLLAITQFFQKSHITFSRKDFLPACIQAYTDCVNEIRKIEPEFEPYAIDERITICNEGNAQPFSNHLQALCSALGKGKSTQTEEQKHLVDVVKNCTAMKGFARWKITIT